MTRNQLSDRNPQLWDLADIVGILRRRWLWLAAVPALLAVGALAFGLLVPRQYAAKTTLVIDPRGLQVVERELTPASQNSTINLAVIESQISVITSDTVLRRVVRQERLAADPEFTGGRFSVVGAIRSAISGLLARTGAPSDPEVDAMTALRRAVRAERVINSYVIDLFVKSTDPAKAARLANAIAAVYITSEREGRVANTARATDGLTKQLSELRQKVQEAERKVEAFKVKHNILSARGGLVSEQQIAELTNQIVNAGVQVSLAQARYDQIASLLRGGAPTDAIGESLQSRTISDLRVRLAAARQLEATLMVSLRPAHPSVRSAQASVATIQAQIRGELSRIAQTARADLERAKANEKQLVAARDALRQQAERTNAVSIELRELERAATANRSVYESFLVRTKEIAGQKEVDTSNARIVTPAATPRDAMGPGLMLLLAGALALGFGAGAVGALISEQLATAPSAMPMAAPRVSPPAASEPSRDTDERPARSRPPLRIWPADAANEDDAVKAADARAAAPERTQPSVQPTAAAPRAPVLFRQDREQDDLREPTTMGAAVTSHAAVRPRLVAQGGAAPIYANVEPLPRRATREVVVKPVALNTRPAPAERRQEIEVLAEIDAAQMKGRALSAVVLDEPGSRSARPFMSLIRSIRKKRGIRRSIAVLVVAPERHRGSAHVALNLASAAVLQEENVLLIDGDVRGRKLTRLLCPQATVGAGDVARGAISLEGAVWHDPETFDLLPASMPVRGAVPAARYNDVFDEARRRYGVVIADAGSLGPSSIGARIASCADNVILVVCARPGETDVQLDLPDQIRLQGGKVIGAIAVVTSAKA